ASSVCRRASRLRGRARRGRKALPRRGRGLSRQPRKFPGSGSSRPPRGGLASRVDPPHIRRRHPLALLIYSIRHQISRFAKALAKNQSAVAPCDGGRGASKLVAERAPDAPACTLVRTFRTPQFLPLPAPGSGLARHVEATDGGSTASNDEQSSRGKPA